MVADDLANRSTAQAAAHLRQLLLTKSAYRRRWQLQVERNTGGEPNINAIAKVVAAHLWDTGERSEKQADLPITLKDRIRRALTGQGMTMQTVEWITGAFDMEPRDRTSIEMLLMPISSSTGIADTLSAPWPLARPQQHRTIALFEEYEVGLAGLVRRHTRQVIVALTDLEGYIYGHEPYASSVQLLQGGQLGQRLEYGDGLVGHEIVLEKPLARGVSAILEYATTYEVVEPVVTEVRRAFRGRAENISMTIRFLGRPLLGDLEFCVWANHVDDSPVAADPVAHRTSDAGRVTQSYAENTVLGFRWGRRSGVSAITSNDADSAPAVGRPGDDCVHPEPA